MDKNNIKWELINRYKYLYLNSKFILGPYVNEKTLKIDKLPQALLLKLESFLLSDIEYNKSTLYNYMLEKENDKKYLYMVKRGVLLEENSNINLDFWQVLSEVREFIYNQSTNLNNKSKKLTALDEYFRINRYSCDEKIWTSGYCINCKDIMTYSNYNYSKRKNMEEPNRSKNDVGQRKSKFINYVADYNNHYKYNSSILTEEEKKDIYLSLQTDEVLIPGEVYLKK